MEDFYKKWFKKNQQRLRGGQTSPERSTSPQPGPSHTRDDSVLESLDDPTKIIYENDSLKLVVDKGTFKKQKIFRLQDHLFHFRIVFKKPNEQLPLLSDIYDFLHAALLHVLESIKSFYRPEDHNIAYLTLHQEPMINGLNTGSYASFVILPPSLISFMSVT